jgi:hypothetical protein
MRRFRGKGQLTSSYTTRERRGRLNIIVKGAGIYFQIHRKVLTMAIVVVRRVNQAKYIISEGVTAVSNLH